MRIGVFASGTGSILTAMLDEKLSIEMVLVDRPCRAEELASAAGIPTVTIERLSFGDDFDRDSYTDLVTEAVIASEIDLVAMAGFGTILGGRFFQEFEGRVLNTHPALLPSFRGWHAVRDALAAGVKVTGCTVHIVTETLDDGPILAQRAVEVFDGDDEVSLHERIKKIERELYPTTIVGFIERLEPRKRLVP